MIDIYTLITGNTETIDRCEIGKQIELLGNQGITQSVISKKISSSLFLESFFEDYESLISALKNRFGERIKSGPLMKFTTASEFVSCKLKLSIEGTKYINTELSGRDSWKNGYINDIREFMAHTFCIPVIHNIERYPAVRKSPELIDELRKMGCVISVSVFSALNKKLKPFFIKLLKSGLADIFVTGTDFDYSSGNLLSSAIAEFKNLCPQDCFMRMQENSRLILQNKKIINGSTCKLKKFFWFYI